MDRVEIGVMGSQLYRVTFLRVGVELSAFCDCEAGKKGTPCKHRLSVLRGDLSAIVSGAESAAVIAEWFAGSRLQAAMQHLADAETSAGIAKAAVADAKRQLARVMHAG